jgi:ribosomal protein S18 acetylase RimI-like enzyme
MTAAEFAEFRLKAIRSYAAEHVEAGNWAPEEAERRATSETDQLLPQGADTPGMLLLVAETEAGSVGTVWVAVEDPNGSGPWIYDIEIDAGHRRSGLGRALLSATERAVAERGGKSLGLNVFAGNDAARRLYDSSGYGVASLHMRKAFGDADSADVSNGVSNER